MGRWAPDTLAWAHVYLAHGADGQLLGFVTVHATPREHTLDLMRAGPDVPDGLMYLLVSNAIEAAGRSGVPRFSLAAVPVAPDVADPAPLRVLRRRLETASGAGGLRHFKQAFAPRWETLYIAAPSLLALAAGALDVAREITRDV
jgi:phosphatidylglycerol lysyltransferase